MTITEAPNQFTDSEGDVFTVGPGLWGEPTVVLSVKPRGDDEPMAVEFFASDADRMIELIRAASK